MPNTPHLQRRETLSDRISEELRTSILTGILAPGDKLPSEAQLGKRHGVSRTVVREAIAALRLDGLVEAKQGAGVFVIERGEGREQDGIVEQARLSGALEVLEIRTPVEVAAAGLAAIRRSPAQEEHILQSHAAVMQCIEQGSSFREADFVLHLAIAEATNNSQFPDFLRQRGKLAIPQSKIVTGDAEEAERDYHKLLIKEHQDIVIAISKCDKEGAEEAMRRHLIGSQERHRDLLRALRIGGDASI